MAYTNIWNHGTPTGGEAANTLGTIISGVKLDIEERVKGILGIPDFTVDPLPRPIIGDGTALSGSSFPTANVLGLVVSVLAGASFYAAQQTSLKVAAANANAQTAFSGYVYATHTAGVVTQLEAVSASVEVAGNGGTVTRARPMESNGLVSTGATVTNWQGVYVSNPGGAGAITNQYGVYIQGFSRGSTLNCGLLIENITGTGNNAIKTGTGPVSFGDKVISNPPGGTASFNLAAVAVGSPVNGDMWYDSGTSRLMFYSGGVAKTITWV